MPIRPIKPPSAPEARAIMPPVRTRTRPAAQSQENSAEADQADPHPSEAEPDFAAGYRKPPIASQFKPGQSGNPKGRPKAAKGLRTIVRDTLTQKVSVRTASGEKLISRIEAALHKTVELAMKGNPRALAQLIKLYSDAVPDTNSSADQQMPVEDLTATDVATLEELRLILTAGKEPGG